MAGRLLVALGLTLMSVKAGGDGKKPLVLTKLENAKREPVNTFRVNNAFMTSTTIEPCKSKEKFIEKYSQETYDSIIKVDGGKVLGKYYWAKNYVSTTKGLNEKDPKKEENFLVLSRSFYIDLMFYQIKSEIENLQNPKNVGLTPNFRLCFYEFIYKTPKRCVYTIILENHNGGQTKEKSLEKFRGFKPHMQVYKVLQMAMLIIDLHRLGITHQSIMPESFVSTDAEM